MAKRKAVQAEVPSTGMTPETRDMLMKMCMWIRNEGSVSEKDLMERFGPDGWEQGKSILYRGLRVLVERQVDWKDGKKARVYSWGDQRFSKSQLAKLPPDLGFLLQFSSSGQLKYTDYQHMAVRCRWTNHVLGAIPTTDAEGLELNVFERDAEGRVLLPAYCCRAMATKALPLLGKEQALGRRIAFQAVRIVNPKLSIVQHGIVDPSGGGGLGLRRSEQLAAGTEFVISAYFPTSVLKGPDFIEMLRIAGAHVRLSPARSAGYGDFEVLGLVEEG